MTTEFVPTVRRLLNTFDATMIAVGIVIGAGIFKTPALVADITGSMLWMMCAWSLGGVLSFCGALTYAELAGTYPSTGGEYTFLSRAYGKNVSFVFAWARSTVIVTGSIALIGFILGDYLTALLPLGPYSSAIYAAIAVALLTLFNLLGIRNSARFQNALTILEVLGVLLVVAAGAWLGGKLDPASVITAHAAGPANGAFGLAMVFVLLTYGGWNEVAYLSAEVRGGAPSIARALVSAIAIVTVVYVILVLAAVSGLGLEAFAASSAFGVDLMTQAFGPVGGQLIGAIVAISAVTSMNATMLVGARSNFAIGNDWRLFSFLGSWRDERNVPQAGFLVQAAIALGLVALGALEKDGFATMVEFTAPVFWFFFFLSGLALFILRSKDPHAVRPFRVPWYPIIPGVFVATCAYLFYSSLVYAQSRNAGFVAIAVTALGLVVLLFTRWHERRNEKTREPAVQSING